MNRLVAALYDRVMAGPESACLADWRAELLGELQGEVIEIGAGTGANLPHYNQPQRLVLTEPDVHMGRRLIDRLDSHDAARLVAAPAQDLPFDDASFDVAVSTLVLCSVPDPQASLAELYRVLRPGGELRFLEHVAASDNPTRLSWQRRWDPLWRRLFDGCRLCRRTGDAIREAGFEITELRRASMRKAPAIVRPTIRGIARKPA